MNGNPNGLTDAKGEVLEIGERLWAIKPRLRELEFVTIIGFTEEKIRVKPYPTKMSQYADDSYLRDEWQVIRPTISTLP